MKFFYLFFSVLLSFYISINRCRCSPDIAKLEDDQRILLNTLKRNKDLNRELDHKFKFLNRKDDKKSLNSFSSTVPVENEGSLLKIDTNYTPPVIVLLPEDSTSREKWEYAVTLKCLGKDTFDAFTNIHNTRMAKMATISGTTVAEINAEIKETENELLNVKKELEDMKEKKNKSKPPAKNDFKEMKRHLHMDHNIKLLNQEIHVMEVKLNRLKLRLKSAILFGSNTNDKNKSYENNKSQNNENEEEDEEDSGGGADQDEEEDEGDDNEEDY